MPLIRNASKRLPYPVDIIAQCVRWYLTYALSLRDLEDMMAECGVVVDHSTLHRWVIRLVPLLDKAFRRHKRAVGRRWRMDETYIKIKGQWIYLYRAVDTAGQTIDFQLIARRSAAAALRFFSKAIRHHGEPEVVTIDKSGPIPPRSRRLVPTNRKKKYHHHARQVSEQPGGAGPSEYKTPDTADAGI